MNSNRWIATLVDYSAPSPTVTIMREPRFLKLLLQRQAIAVREEWVNKTSFLACQRHNPYTQGTTCLGNTPTSKTQFKSCQKRSFSRSKKSGKIKQGQYRSQLTSPIELWCPLVRDSDGQAHFYRFLGHLDRNKKRNWGEKVKWLMLQVAFQAFNVTLEELELDPWGPSKLLPVLVAMLSINFSGIQCIPHQLGKNY